MRFGARNVIGRQASIEGLRGGETLHKSVGRLAKAAAPQSLAVVGVRIAHGPRRAPPSSTLDSTVAAARLR